MFVRFRQAGSRLQCSLIETSRGNGKVRHEHIAALGTIDTPPTVADRVEFWRRLHERIGQLSNRVDGTAQAKIDPWRNPRPHPNGDDRRAAHAPGRQHPG